MSDWQRYTLDVRMPHLAPGARLSEVELLKQLGAFQWETIAGQIGRPASQITNANGDRLYASFVEIELELAGDDTLEALGEDARIHLANRVRFYGGKFVDGVMVFGQQPVSDEDLAALGERDSLRKRGMSWACMTNAFIARNGSNAGLRVFRPKVDDDRALATTREPPDGIQEQIRVQSGGELRLDGDEGAGTAVEPAFAGPIVYPISPESDLNGAGLLYFARYPAIIAHAERVFFTERLATPVSRPLVACLSTRARRLVYFANAADTDTVEVRLRARLEALTDDAATLFRTPLALWLEADLRRGSDKVLMARSSARKVLRIPADAKPVVLEATSWVASCGNRV